MNQNLSGGGGNRSSRIDRDSIDLMRWGVVGLVSWGIAYISFRAMWDIDIMATRMFIDHYFTGMNSSGKWALSFGPSLLQVILAFMPSEIRNTRYFAFGWILGIVATVWDMITDRGWIVINTNWGQNLSSGILSEQILTWVVGISISLIPEVLFIMSMFLAIWTFNYQSWLVTSIFKNIFIGAKDGYQSAMS